ncbi:hypothetical protein IV500_17110 [Paeniglutamicibacter antarcticus]|uniref:Uncharacterized protein n=1 Tax=Arthrobacter terrae TaxID=2935737 RepID=A0A931CTE6_9MICC|nr:hypothetical protein [Arthrobacter terrae]MBG0741094.1 hypothetical protein [Arthrobacter terrae]
MAIEERFLGLDGPARIRQAQHEHERLDHDAANHGLELAEANLLGTPRPGRPSLGGWKFLL